MSFEPLTFILERVGQLLVDEVKFLATDKDELLRKLRQQLELAQSFVMDVEDLKQQSAIAHVLETESQHIKQIIPQFEDYLDELYFEEESEKSQQPSSIQKFMACFSCSSNPLVHRHMAIDTALKLIEDLEDTRKRAGSFQRPSNIPQVIRERSPQTLPDIMNEEFIVGLDEDVKTLVIKLKGTDGERTTILAIVGMGGSGKTTLTRKLFNHEEIKRHFTSHLAWVCVSQEWDAPRLLREICVQLEVPVTEGEFSNAGLKLREFLETSSCLVVLDDVWEMKALRELLPSLLPRGGREGNGRVLITTRNEEILQHPTQGGVHIHKARALTSEKSWELFSKIVRNKWQGKMAFDDESMLAKLGKEMLERCNGLPLAVVALAGLLSEKYSIQEWSALKDRVNSTILRQNKGFFDYGPVRSMLELSYLDLPPYLKPCFLYLGIYPEGRAILVDELIQLWIGEGLIRLDLCNEGQTLEELGRDFVDELVRRCMVQLVDMSYDEKPETIQVHDLMRDLCIEKARESGFFEIASQLTTPSNSKASLSRRAIFRANGKPHLMHTSRLRSFFLFHNLSTKFEIAYGEMRLLRVLYLFEIDMGESAQEIGNLTLLRYLRILNCRGVTTTALKSMERLTNLLTLDITGVDDATIPNRMAGNMKKLRFFHVTCGWTAQFEETLGLEGPGSLQMLYLSAGEWLSKELSAANFILTLRALNLYMINSQAQLDAVNDFVSNPSNHLQDLLLTIYDEDSGLNFDLQGMKLESCPLLERMTLDGRISEQKGQFFFPPNLLTLVLVGSKLEKADILERALTHLHQLRSLKLGKCAFEGDTLAITGLLQLQRLKLYRLGNLREWRISEGSLPQLKDLEIWVCRKLERIPEGLGKIHNLQYFHLFGVTPSLRERLRKPLDNEDSNERGGIEGQDFHMIRHVPKVIIF